MLTSDATAGKHRNIGLKGLNGRNAFQSLLIFKPIPIHCWSSIRSFSGTEINGLRQPVRRVRLGWNQD
jgi:hypothetical protein